MEAHEPNMADASENLGGVISQIRGHPQLEHDIKEAMLALAEADKLTATRNTSRQTVQTSLPQDVSMREKVQQSRRRLIRFT